MWCRLMEFVLGCWLALSPFIFRHAAQERFLWWNDLVLASLVALFALLSLGRVTMHAHYLNLLTACWLIGVGFLAAPSPPPPAYQNHVLVGLLLLMFAILPNHASRPPRAWEQFQPQS